MEWKEVDIMNRIENLQFAVIVNFTYDMADMEELGTLIPQQCNNLKVDNQIGII